MKIDRLIGIIFYLINREWVTANELAKEFEVSRRTILRDIDTLTLSGIPIYSELGKNGGYKLNKDFKIDKTIIDNGDKEYILFALNSLSTMYGNKKIKETYEKMKYYYRDVDINTFPDIDFSVISENPKIIKYVDLINKAINEKKSIKFAYTNSKGKKREIYLNPLHTFYRWYSWYTFGFEIFNNNYRIFKISRMNNIYLTNEKFEIRDNIDDLLSDFKEKYNKSKTKVILSYEKEIDVLVDEYFKGKIIEIINDNYIREIMINENDFMSFSILLGLCDKVNIVSPKKYKEKILNHIRKIEKNFDQ